MTNLPVGAPIPGDENSGVDGDQQPGDSTEIAVTPPPLTGELLVDTMRDFINVNPDHFGGPYAGRMLSAHLGDSHYDKAQAQLQIADLQRRLSLRSEELNAEKVLTACLRERSSSSTLRVWFQKICAFATPVALSFAIDLDKTGNNMWKASALIGVFLFVISVFPDLRKKL
ncbi:hypothetical protein ACIOUF_16730 [Pseudomonas iridis]|uniref:DUF2335 domain-containing protein n=1 Tax=Pseudomonas iridis TaxID=2710587 RepID=A0ABW8DN96_9PSED